MSEQCRQIIPTARLTLEMKSRVGISVVNFRSETTLKTPSDKVVDVQIVGVEAAVERGAANLSRRKCARVVVPDSPQFESEPVDRPQRPPVPDEILRRFGAASSSTAAWMKLDHQLLDILEALRTGQDRVEHAPFVAFDVHLQNVDCRLRNTTLP